MRFISATLLLCLLSVPAFAKPSLSPITPFNDDRYAAVTQLGPEVVRSMRGAPPMGVGKASKARYLYRVKKHKAHQRVPVPRERPEAAPREIAPMTLAGGAGREAWRALGPRPRAWCGWWLGKHLGMHDRRLWLARNWATVGARVHGPQVGAVVVWRHHVGIITGQRNGQWVVKSGNDGHAVRERPRSVAGAISFRMIGGRG